MRACSWSRSTTGCTPCAARDPAKGDKARILRTMFLSSSISDVAVPSSVIKRRRCFSSCSSSRKQDSQAATRCFSFDWLRRMALRRFDCQVNMRDSKWATLNRSFFGGFGAMVGLWHGATESFEWVPTTV